MTHEDRDRIARLEANRAALTRLASQFQEEAGLLDRREPFVSGFTAFRQFGKPAVDHDVLVAVGAGKHHLLILQGFLEEAVGIVSGAWMGGMRGAVLMQTSGFATLANVLASLAIPYQIPLIMFVSERGTLGEFNYGQSLVCRTMRPVLDSLAMEHHTATRLDEFEFIVDRSIKQAITTQAPVALILSPLLTGGKVFDK